MKLLPFLLPLALGNFSLISAKAIPYRPEHNATMEVINVGPLEAEPVPDSFLPTHPNATDPDASVPKNKASDWTFGFYICEHAPYWGLCSDLVCRTQEGVCCNIPAEWRNTISSIRPDPGIICNLYEYLNCGGSEYMKEIGYPGFPNLDFLWPVKRDPPLAPLLRNFNDKLKSFRCRLGS